MTISLDYIAELLQLYLLPFFRIGALFLTMPVIGTRVVSPRVRVILAALITMVVVPILPAHQPLPLFSLDMLGRVAFEVLLGGTAGFVFQIVFQCFVLTGQLVAMKIGLGFASMNDPANGVQTTVISQFYLVAATLLFVVYDAHLVLIELVAESFFTIPVGQASSIDFMALAKLGSWLFASALLMSIALLTALLLVNVAFGVMSRAAPQLNIFAVGFPFTLTLGMLLIWLGLGGVIAFFERVVEFGFVVVNDILRLT